MSGVRILLLPSYTPSLYSPKPIDERFSLSLALRRYERVLHSDQQIMQNSTVVFDVMLTKCATKLILNADSKNEIVRQDKYVARYLDNLCPGLSVHTAKRSGVQKTAK